jgi:hypothetical protein
MKRREFITLLGAVTIAKPPAADAQVVAGKPARVGLFASDNPVMGPATDAFLDELRRAGFVEGQNFSTGGPRHKIRQHSRCRRQKWSAPTRTCLLR